MIPGWLTGPLHDNEIGRPFFLLRSSLVVWSAHLVSGLLLGGVAESGSGVRALVWARLYSIFIFILYFSGPFVLLFHVYVLC